MNLQRPLLPKFLKKREDNLLLHKPDIWSTRTHLVLYYGILFMALLALITCIVPDDPREPSSSDIWVGFVSILSVIGLVVWLIYLLRFNVFKRYGIIRAGDRLLIFLLYFISAAVLILFTYVQPVTESIRANRTYGNEEVVRDINTINSDLCRLEYDSLNHSWFADTLKFVPLPKASNDYLSPYEYESSGVIVDTVVATVNRPHYSVLDTSAKEQRLAQADSLRQISDSVYIAYQCPPYTFLFIYDSDPYSTVKEYKSKDIYEKFIRNYTPPDKAAVYAELKKLLVKYDPQWNEKPIPKQISYTYPYSDYAASMNLGDINQNHIQRMQMKYKLGDVSESLRNIIQRKYRWAPHRLSDHLRVLYYFALSISLLVFIFRHTTTRAFFLSLLTGILLTLFTALLMAFGNFRETGFLGWLLFYFLLFFVLSLWAWKTRTRNLLIGIAINLFVFLVPFVPLIGVSFYYALLRAENRKDYYNAYSDDLSRYLPYAEIAGAVILLILLGTYIQALYRRWYALPEE